MKVTKQPKPPAPRSLQEWMERTQTNGQQLLKLIREVTGREISATLLSFYLRGSRRVSQYNALAIHVVTGVPIENLTEWPKVSKFSKPSGGQSKQIA